MFEAMWMPSTRSVSLSARNLTMPSVWPGPIARARELAMKGNLPTWGGAGRVAVSGEG